MFRMSSVVIIAISAATFAAASPLASAQTNTANASFVQHQEAQPMPVAQAKTSPAADQCFTQDFVPGDESSMATICSTAPAPAVSFAP